MAQQIPSVDRPPGTFPRRTRLSHANRGRRLESAVIASQRDVIRVRKTSAGAKWLAGGKAVRQVGPPDFIGTVVGSGRSICFEAKQSDRPNGFPLDMVRPHQLDYLTEQGQAGAVAGVLVESTAKRLYLWLTWGDLNGALRSGLRSIPWGDGRFFELGHTSYAIPFDRVPGVEWKRATP